jgi:hypothetical protein
VDRARSTLVIRTAARGSLCLLLSGCMTLAPQLAPTDYAKLEQVKERKARDEAFQDNTIYRHEEPQGTRYTKGNVSGTTKRSWQSLDAVLRSDQNSSAALPAKQLRRSRVFTALALTSSIVFIAGGAATARTGFDFKEPSAANATLLGGALLSVAFAIVAGVLYRRARTGYDRAVDIYNDSLGMRLGVMTPQGAYIPPSNVMVDAEGYVITEDKGASGAQPSATTGSQPQPQPQPSATTGSQPQPVVQPPAAVQPPATTGSQPAPGPVAPQRAQLPARPARPELTAPSGAPDAPAALLRRDPAAPVGALTLLPQR